jgi:AcrR family transcriptional regulator
MATPPGTERRTGAETRAEILRVALDLFTEKGFEGTSTRDISSALGITKSSLYYHFQNKDAIVASLMQERRQELGDLIDWIDAQPPAPDLLERTVLRWIDGTTPQRIQLMRLVQANQPVLRRLLNTGNDVRSAFDQVIDRLVDKNASAMDRLFARMVFDTVSAALIAAQGTDISPTDVLAAARRASVALSAAIPQES